MRGTNLSVCVVPLLGDPSDGVGSDAGPDVTAHGLQGTTHTLLDRYPKSLSTGLSTGVPLKLVSHMCCSDGLTLCLYMSDVGGGPVSLHAGALPSHRQVQDGLLHLLPPHRKTHTLAYHTRPRQTEQYRRPSAKTTWLDSRGKACWLNRLTSPSCLCGV